MHFICPPPVGRTHGWAYGLHRLRMLCACIEGHQCYSHVLPHGLTGDPLAALRCEEEGRCAGQGPSGGEVRRVLGVQEGAARLAFVGNVLQDLGERPEVRGGGQGSHEEAGRRSDGLEATPCCSGAAGRLEDRARGLVH